ncbi:SDR family oxidoreductase [Streptomyces sp. NBC_00006]|uniref:SDR family oxidoreductase n=1 Tax=Streptomyces sp. NBC_00006 TaxID=2975619 RepID=UPI002253198D|nr:SDR family oxidoreductase [Streptomyces sp. NBC_00006]MCX5529685.1 SDR family oxidoreductase [Streptomyces sp. NBC_00006]
MISIVRGAEEAAGSVDHLDETDHAVAGVRFGGVAYSAAKAGLLGFARALARELGPAGVTANCVAPGLIDTDITQGKLDDERKAAMIADVPVRRIGEVEDVADVIAFLARPESGY